MDMDMDNNTEYNIGDVVICIDGYSNRRGNDNYGGAGYSAGSVFTISDITDGILWGNEISYGVYSFAVKPYRKYRLDKIR
jgi:hypothetical protein